MADIKIIEEVFKAIDIITDKKIYLTEYLYTEDCIIISKSTDPTVYKVLHQGQEFDAYAPLGEFYEIGQGVVVLFTDYSKITKKIILYGKNSTIYKYGDQTYSYYNKKISKIGVADAITIEGSPVSYNGITYGSPVPSLYFSIDPSLANINDDYYYFSSNITINNPITNNFYEFTAMKIHGSFFGPSFGYPFVQFPHGAYMGFTPDFTYDPISDYISAAVFNNYTNVKIFNTSNSAIDLGTGIYNGPLTKYYYNSGSGSFLLGSIGMTGLGVQIFSNSDYRLKENISTLSNGLEKINLLKPVSWTWKNTESFGEGFLAHEVSEIIPLAVAGEKDKINSDGKPVYQQMDMTKIIPALVSAVQQLSSEVALLKEALQKLKEGDTINGP